MKIKTMEDAFVHGLSDIYSGEKQLFKALQKLAKSASSEALTEAFKTHQQEAQEQIDRIDQLVDSMDIKLQRIKCKAMEGLIEEAKETIEEIEEGPVRDAMLIVAGQKVEHYEIAAYGSLVEMAKKLGYEEAAEVLAETLDEEKATDEKLNMIAINDINDEALQEAA